jgi:nucleotide-binding universal stress UspA family protein
MFSKILVAIDDSEFSQAIFEQALALAKLHQATLMLLHVISPFDDLYLSDPYSGIPHAEMIYWKRRREVEELGIERLRSLESTALKVGIATEFTQSLGEPGKLICALAKNWHADLIVMGRRGLNGLSELFMGSVSNYVLHHADCHVLTLHHRVPSRPLSEVAIAAQNLGSKE